MSEQPDPFQPPREVSSVSPAYGPQSRPTGVTVFGILHVLFGLMGLFGIVMSAVVMLVGARFAPGPNPIFDLLQKSTLYSVFFYTSLVLSFLFSVVLIASGIGLFKMSELARTGSLTYAVYAIISGIIGTVVNFFVLVMPMINQAQQAGGPQAAGAIGGAIGGILGGIIGLIYPVAILIYFLRPSVKEAFRTWNAN